MRKFCGLLLSLWFLASSTVSAEGTLNPFELDGGVTHQVVEGENLGTLSRTYGVAPELIRKCNDGRRPEPGDIFIIPPSPSGWVVHTVSRPQTLQEIAEGYRLPIEQLRQANILSSETLDSGTLLILPRRVRPEWHSEPQVAFRKRRRSLKGSRAGRPIRSFGPLITDSLMSFGKQLGDDKKASIRRMVKQLEQSGFQVQADDIANFMAVETGGTFDPAVCSKHASNPAVGLAQFTDIAIQDLNQRRPAQDQLSKQRLKEMSFDEQSQIVTEYLTTALSRKNMQGKVVTAADMYAAIFCPRAIGLPMDGTVYDRKIEASYYLRNQSLDVDKDGRISKREMVKRLLEWSQRGEVLRG